MYVTFGEQHKSFASLSVHLDRVLSLATGAALRSSEKGLIETCKPVFVVGMNGSGTSMLLDSLGRHPQLYALPDETHMMPYIISRAGRFGDLTVDKNFRAYWQYAIDQLPVLQRRVGGGKLVIPDNWQRFPRSIAGVFDGIFTTLAATYGKRRWCEKTPDHVQHLPLLSGVFEEAKFIHIIRDGREVASSICRRQHRRPELVVFRWKKLVAVGQADGAKLGNRYFELRYENLTEEPRREMKRVCEFLGLEFDEMVLHSRMPQNPGRKRLARDELGRITPNPSKWADYFDIKTVARFETIAGSMLQTLGYSITTTAGDKNPNRFLRRFWRATDFFRIMLERISTRRHFDSLSKVVRNLFFSYKEYRSKKH